MQTIESLIKNQTNLFNPETNMIEERPRFMNNYCKKTCPETQEPVLYLDCLECETKSCQKGCSFERSGGAIPYASV